MVTNLIKDLNTLVKCASCGQIQTLKEWKAKKSHKIGDCCIKCFMRNFVYK